MRRRILLIMLLCGTWAGCGTSKWSDTQRTATEQLLISDAMDRAVSQLDFRALAGKRVYLDTEPLKNSIDSAYLTSSLRQQLLASGCILREKRDDADYVVEARSGSSGTDNHSLLFGVPQTSVPSSVFVPGTAGAPATIPEIPLAKKMEQRAIVKVGLFAYNRETGRPVWQSGLVLTESKAKHIWLFGTGPFQSGTIYDGTTFAGDKKLTIPLINPEEEQANLSVADEAFFTEPPEELAQAKRRAAERKAAGDEQKAAATSLPKSEGPPRGVVPATHATLGGGAPGASPAMSGQFPGPSQTTAFPGATNAPMPPGDRGFPMPFGSDGPPNG
ncbi:MAG: DUF6655 family protein, partial [Thermoguttaceae bacterium]